MCYAVTLCTNQIVLTDRNDPKNTTRNHKHIHPTSDRYRHWFFTFLPTSVRDSSLTVIRKVVNQNDLSQQVRWHGVDDAVNRAQQRRQSLVIEYDNHRRVWEIWQKFYVFTPEKNHTKNV